MGGSGVYVVDSRGHIARPMADTYIMEEDAKPASLLCDADFPVVAECTVCHGRMRPDAVLQMEWYHERVAPAVTGGDAP